MRGWNSIPKYGHEPVRLAARQIRECVVSHPRRAEDKCGGSAGKEGKFWLSGRALNGAEESVHGSMAPGSSIVSLEPGSSIVSPCVTLTIVSCLTQLVPGSSIASRWRLVLRTASRRWPGSLVSAKPHKVDRSMSFWVSVCVCVCLSVGPSLSSKFLSAFTVHYLPCILY